MTTYRLTFNVDDVSPHDFGEWTMLCDDSNVKERTEALVMLGFSPTMEIEREEHNA